jgi:3'-phosphoadenosine 5'-phosphosulfate sulfotransferase (PAPS reductase)/FAD synthetase
MSEDRQEGYQERLFDEIEQDDDAPAFTEGGTQLLAPPEEIFPIEFVRQLDPSPIPGETPPLAKAAEDLTTDEKVEIAIAAIDRVMEAGHPTAWAYSGGKDSSVMMSLGIEAARRRMEAGKPVPPMLVTHANTGIENPAMHAVAMAEIARIKAYTERLGMPLRVDIGQPSMNDSWAVRVISGRALPTFANSSSRDCSVAWKIVPQQRQRKRVMAELGVSGDSPVTVVGTRFEESSERAARMRERGETDTEIWQEQIVGKDGKVTLGGLRLSVIALWTQEDVWVFLSQLGNGQRTSYSDAKDLWEVYADGGNSGGCAVIGDDALKANAKACGARFGCALCTAVGRDKSLESMLEADAKYEYLVPLNRLQRFLVDTQYDIERRGWVGRTINDEGFIAIGPDSYSPEMQRELLRYALSIDVLERSAAAKAGVKPRFKLVSEEQLIAIDAIWSMQGYHPRPFEAIHIWEDVVVRGNTSLPPEVDASRFPKKFPGFRYLYVGTNWDDDPTFDAMYSGGRSLMADFTGATETGGCLENTTLSDGRVVLDVRRSPFFEVDEEGAELFLAYEVLDHRIHEKSAQYRPGYAFEHYQILGTFSTSRQHMGDQDAILRRSAWKDRHGVYDMTREQLLAHTVSRSEMQAGVRAPEGRLTLREELDQKTRAERAETRKGAFTPAIEQPRDEAVPDSLPDSTFGDSTFDDEPRERFRA